MSSRTNGESNVALSRHVVFYYNYTPMSIIKGECNFIKAVIAIAGSMYYIKSLQISGVSQDASK